MTIPEGFDSVRISGDEMPMTIEALSLMERSGRLTETDAAIVAGDLAVMRSMIDITDTIKQSGEVSPYKVDKYFSAVVHKPEILKSGLEMIDSLFAEDTALSGLNRFFPQNRHIRNEQRAAREMLRQINDRVKRVQPAA